ncbi:MAG: DUF268 domain-containing protein [Lachnospiraceae bacterium]|nr:DUF268 domain-containing protein [Lachnospiraceae bacterium]
MKLYVWGTGKSTKKLLDFGINGNVVGFIESNVSKIQYEGKPVFAPQEVKEYDCIIVASIYVDEIYDVANECNMNFDKFIFMNFCYLMSKRDNSALARKVLAEINYQKYVIEFNFYDKSFFADDREKYISMNRRKSFEICKKDERPILTDKYKTMGIANQYFWQDLWAASLIGNKKPQEHFDIGSRLDGFIAHIIAMSIPITVIDVRPFPMKIVGLKTIVADATMLNEIEDESIESLSALCSLEHFGLGRYGDPIDPEACFKCFKQIQKKVKAGGYIYISVPIGREKLQFNAHRIFKATTIIEEFDKCELLEFSACNEEEIEYKVDINKYDSEDNSGGRFGLFCFRKR